MPITFRCLLISSALLLPLGCAPFASAQTEPQAPLATMPIQAGMHIVQAEIAQTPEQRQMGLMLRKTMADSHGMMFVFEQAATQCFWMKNTLLPLTIAFVADDGRIVNFADMKPMDENSHCSKEKVRFALEMNKGWFDKRGLKEGSKLKSNQLFSVAASAAASAPAK